MLQRKRTLFSQVVDDLSDSHSEKAITRDELLALYDLEVPQSKKADFSVPKIYHKTLVPTITKPT